MNIDFDFETLYKNERISLKEVFDTIRQHIKTEDIIDKLTENEKYYIKLHIDNNKNIMSIKTDWDEFENNKKIMKDIRKSFDKKTNYIMLYLQVVSQNDKDILSFFENLKKNIIENYFLYYIIIMPLSFKISFEKIDFKDEEFVTDIAKVEEFYNAGIVLEYKQNKEKLTKKFSSYSELMQFIEMDENDSIKYGNLIFYNIDIPELKQKFKERNL